MKTIKPDDAVLYTLDTSLPVGTRKAGRKKRTGYVVDTYKVYKDAGWQCGRTPKTLDNDLPRHAG